MAKHYHSNIVLTYNPNSICRLAMNTNVYQRLPSRGTWQKPSKSCYARPENIIQFCIFLHPFHSSIKIRFGRNQRKAHHRIDLWHLLYFHDEFSQGSFSGAAFLTQSSIMSKQYALFFFSCHSLYFVISSSLQNNWFYKAYFFHYWIFYFSYSDFPSLYDLISHLDFFLLVLMYSWYELHAM